MRRHSLAPRVPWTYPDRSATCIHLATRCMQLCRTVKITNDGNLHTFEFLLPTHKTDPLFHGGSILIQARAAPLDPKSIFTCYLTLFSPSYPYFGFIETILPPPAPGLLTSFIPTSPPKYRAIPFAPDSFEQSLRQGHFRRKGMEHLKLYFDDGRNSMNEMVRDFVARSGAVHEARGVVAVHICHSL